MAKLRVKKSKARYFEFLIDSGADYTLISKTDAYVLGIDYKKIRKKEIKLIGYVIIQHSMLNEGFMNGY